MLQIAPGIGDPIRVILSVERDCALGPFEVRGHGCADCANFSEFALPLTRGEASRTSPKDQEAVLDLGEPFSLRVVVLGGLFSALLDYDVGVIPTQDSALLKGVLGWAPMIGAWFLQHLVEETGASRSPLGVLAICRGYQVVVRLTCFPLRPFFFLGSRELEASVASAFCFPLAVPSEKMAPTASLPEAKLVAMSSN